MHIKNEYDSILAQSASKLYRITGTAAERKKLFYALEWQKKFSRNKTKNGNFGQHLNFEIPKKPKTKDIKMRNYFSSKSIFHLQTMVELIEKRLIFLTYSKG